MTAAGLIGRSTNRPGFRLFAKIPSGFLAQAVSDRGCEPLITFGEVAVITDQDGLYPESGGWYLMEYSRGNSYRGRARRGRSISEVFSAERDGNTWWYAKSPGPRMRGIVEMCDGPYSDVNCLAERILGRVVGIYAPQRAVTDPNDDELLAMINYQPDWVRPQRSAHDHGLRL